MNNERIPMGMEGNQDVMREEINFREFIDANSYTQQELMQAYHILGGGPEAEPVFPEIRAIVDKMEELSDSGFPMNRFHEIIQSMGEMDGNKKEPTSSHFGSLEDILSATNQYIDRLKVSNKEKQMLRSIVENQRKGEVSCLVNGRVVASFKTARGPSDQSDFAGGFVRALEEIVNRIPVSKKYEFTFEE